ncbi:nucleotide exchange factor GrpE [Oceanobacillus chungangensis]|uniref:Protein GrpE n=1 Tax=Oceanobacillus chungangensis TaxID=1229152 RepID=A0A3D8Q3G8_9BACI|nr:nucleotide exchange factor GrpE [Oceanobacillus chungangensis]RDW21755.1 nucleotide exchange factor GrpE [Oceanobacillus chungangensis]
MILEVANLEDNKERVQDETIAQEEVEQEIIDSDDDGQEETETQDSALKKVETLQKEKDEVYSRLLRLQAEFDNFKKRSQKEKDADRKYKSQDVVVDLLPALDNFERALQVESTPETSNLIEGISMVYRQFQDALKSQGVEPIETEGKEFDPNLHHAVMQVEDESIASNTVVEELQKGYMLKDRVIRPAMVKVNK